MYQQQNHPIDDILREHIHGVTVSAPQPKPRPKPRKKKVLKTKKVLKKQGKYGYTYNIDGTYQ